MRRCLKQHWVYVTAFGVGLMLTPFAIRAAYAARGYFAVGGEYLVLPIALLIAGLIDSIKETLDEIKKDA